MDASGIASAPHSAPGSAAKERHSLSLDQRRALRRWANSQTVRPSHKACIEWFASEYGQTISQSTVSHSLSPKYARLDGDPQLSGSRLRFGNWPDVEKLVLMWHHGMVNSGRQPTNEELADKAKSIFQQLPRYKDEQPPEFSPGWIHRFKKRYGLLIRRQRRHGTAPPPQDDIPYLVDTVPRFMSITPDTSPAAIREAVNRIVGVEPSLATCARVRDEIVRRLENPQNGSNSSTGNGQASASGNAAHAAGAVDANMHGGGGGGDPYGEDDPEVLLQNALQALQQEEAEAEAQAAAEREARDREDRGLPPLDATSYAQQAAGAALATPVRNGVVAGSTGGGGGAASADVTQATGSGPDVPPQPAHRSHQQQPQQQQPSSSSTTPSHQHPHQSPQYQQQQQQQPPPQQPQPQPQPLPQQPHAQQTPARFTPASGTHDSLTLTPIPANGPISSTDRPQRCPFCINQRMLRTIKEAVEHMATHVVV